MLLNCVEFRAAVLQKKHEKESKGGGTIEDKWNLPQKGCYFKRLTPEKREYNGNITYSIYIRNLTNLDNKKRKMEIFEVPENFWFVGDIGTGKTYTAYKEYAPLFLKGCTKYWDNYNNEETVLIDDFCQPNRHLVDYLRLWSSPSPFLAEMKNKPAIWIRPKRIIITSRFEPSDFWSKEEGLDNILRHFTIIGFSTPYHLRIKDSSK